MKLMDLRRDIEKEMELMSEWVISFSIPESEHYLSKIRELKCEYQVEIEVLIDKFTLVIKDSEVLDRWTVDLDDIDVIF